MNDGTNPHGTTKSDVGLGNVDNTSDINKPISNATQNALDDKVDKVPGMGLSQENFTITLKDKLDGIEAGAEVNVQADWAQSDNTADDYIKNKPTIPTVLNNHSQLTLDDGTNPHGTTKSDVGLGNVDNTSDMNKPISTTTQTALNGKEDVANKATDFSIINDTLYPSIKAVDDRINTLPISQLIREEFTYLGGVQTFTLISNYTQVYSVEVQGQGALSLSQYDLILPNQIEILDELELGDYIVVIYSDSISGTLSHYSQAQVDNLISTKQDILVSGGNIKTLEGQSLLGSGNIDLDKTSVGLNNVDNTSDVDKPISTATQTALNSKLDKDTTAGVERVWVYGTDGIGSEKPTSDFKDVLEFVDFASFPTTGESGKIYVALDTNFTYRWTGSVYVQIGGGIKSRITNTSVSGSYVLNHSLASDWKLTLTGATTLSEINLPTGDDTIEFTLKIFGNFPLTIPAYWTVKGDSYSTTLWNFYAIQIHKGDSPQEATAFLTNL